MQNEKRPDDQPADDKGFAPAGSVAAFDPSAEPSVEEVEARSTRETKARLTDVEGRDISEVLLARIEAEGRELYAINQNLEGALLLSIAISLCTSAAVPVAAREEDTSDYRTAYPDDEPKSNPPRKAKSVLRKVGAASRAGTSTAKSGGGKGSKGRDDKSATGRSSSGVRHWDRPAGHTRGKKAR
jgi:hypothetical protein